ncbi:MAG: hypothetical protein ACE5I2_00905 [Anaerolineae bacterium]
MLFNPWTAYRLAEERMKDAMREAEQARLIRAAKGPRKELKWRLQVTLILKSLLAILTNRRVDASRRQPPSTTSSLTRKMANRRYDSRPACC